MEVGERYRFPTFELCTWYALQEVTHQLRSKTFDWNKRLISSEPCHQT